MELSVVLLCLSEKDNLERLLPQVQGLLSSRSISYEILVVDGGSQDGTRELCQRLGVSFFVQKDPGYGGALREGFARAAGDHVVTMDADLSHPPHVVLDLFRHREEADILVASRYVWGGWAEMSRFRIALSRVLNRVCHSVLLMPLHDFSSGFRLYRKEILPKLSWQNKDFSSLIEIVAHAYAQGYSVKEIPFHYRPRGAGKSHARLLKFFPSYLKMMFRLWRLRNSLESSDYDEHAFYSRIPLQRYWQRKRYRIVLGLLGGYQNVLDVGCGSSVILSGLSQSVGMDIALPKLRSQKRRDRMVVCGSIFELPFRTESFDSVLCSEVIEHVPKKDRIFEEFRRVLKPGGTLVVGTPDHKNWLWLVLERIYLWVCPKGHVADHISRYTRKEVGEVLKRFGFKTVEVKSILGCEVIFKALKE
ncbi:MAG: glycosyltransferase [Elusimicrobia bacterium]|nr:glycosyltransferase [Elusimicrobiota bacterium]